MPLLQRTLLPLRRRGTRRRQGMPLLQRLLLRLLLPLYQRWPLPELWRAWLPLLLRCRLLRKRRPLLCLLHRGLRLLRPLHGKRRLLRPLHGKVWLLHGKLCLLRLLRPQLHAVDQSQSALQG